MPTLDWIGKNKVVNHHLEVPFKVLDKKYTFSADGKAEDSENKIIHGDNLEALKALLPEYESKIKCIYIDPPYNTGNEGWVYNDNVNDPKIKKWLGEVVGQEGEDLTRHDKWLCMMYPRLKLLQRLLSDDGAIFISIGQEEITNCNFICDEIFGLCNKIGQVSRVTKTASNNGTFFAPTLDYILCYAKNINNVSQFEDDVDESLYKKIEDKGIHKGEKYRDDVALYQAALNDLRPNQKYFIDCPDGSKVIPPCGQLDEIMRKGDGRWRWSKEKYLQFKDLLVFKETKNSPLLDQNGNKAKYNVYTKSYLSERQKTGTLPRELWDHFINRKGADLIKKMGISFDYSKPVELLEYIYRIICLDENAIVLDSFAGSGTTAHALLKLNKKDGGNRKFILIELNDYAESITAERIRRVIKGYAETEGTGGDFSFYELGPRLLLENGFLNEEVPLEKLREYVWFTETHSKLQNALGIKNENEYFLGKFNQAGYWFYYEKDKPTTLSIDFLGTIGGKYDQYIIYADICLLPKDFMVKNNIIFKKIPRDIKKF